MAEDFGPINPNLISLAMAIGKKLAEQGYKEPSIYLSVIGVDVIWDSLHVYCFLDEEDLTIDFFDASLRLSAQTVDYPKDVDLDPAQTFSIEIAKTLELGLKSHFPS